MADITTIGIAVDSSGVRTAAVDLNKMAKEGKAAEVAVKDLTGSVVKGALMAQQLDRAIVSLVGGVTNAVRQFVSLGFAVGDYMDIADRTMADPAGLASLRTAADVSGTSISSVATTLQMMQRQLAKSSDESKGAAAALKAIGLEAAAFSRLSPDEQIRSLAIALEGYSDKLVIAQAVLGRGGAQQLGFLKELASEGKRSNIITAEMIKMSDDIGDSIKRQQSETRQLTEAMAVGTLPAINAVFTALNEYLKSLLGVNTETGRLAANNKVREWAYAAAESLSYVVSAATATATAFQVIGKTAGAAMAIAGSFMTDDPKLFAKKRQAILEAVRGDVEGLTTGPSLGDTLRKSIQQARDADAAFDSGPKADYDDPRLVIAGRKKSSGFTPATPKAKTGKTDAQREADKYERVLSRVQARIEEFTDAQGEELAAGDKLTAADKLRLSVMADLAAEGDRVTLSTRNRIVGMLSEAKAAERVRLQAEEDAKYAIASARETSKLRDQEQASTQALQDRLAALRATSQEYGATRDELHEKAQRALLDEEATLRFNAQQNGLLETQADLLRAIREEQDALFRARKRDAEDPEAGVENAIKKYVDESKKLGDSMEGLATRSIKGIEDALTSLATGGKADVRGLINSIIAEFVRLAVIKPLLADIFGGSGAGGGGLGGLLRGVFQLFGSGAGGGGGSNGEFGGPGVPMATGTNRVPYDGFRATLHKDEAVVPAAYNPAIGRGSGGGLTIHYRPSISVDARSDASQVAGVASAIMAQGQRALLAELRAQGVF